MLIYRVLGHKLKGDVFPGCFLGVSKGRLFLGQGSFINYSCFLDLSDDIVIGKNVAVGFKTTFINATHEMGSSEQRAGNGASQPIRIEDGCWIGAGVTIMPGVTIARGCIIGAGALVTQSTEPNCVYAGVPAKKIKEL